MKIMLAVEWCEMSEAGLEQHIYLDTKQANMVFPLRDGRSGPRFVYYHTKRSMYSPKGFLDDVLVDRERFLYHQWENKRESTDSKVSPEQQFWIDMLLEGGEPTCGGYHVLCHGVVRPSDWFTRVRQTVLGV